MRMILGFLLLLAGCTTGPPTVTEYRTFDGPAPRGVAMLRDAMERGHARARAEVGAPALQWNEALAADAARYAVELARSGKFQHSREPRGAQPEGENLWKGTRDAYFYSEMVGHWAAEKIYYRPGPTPDFSTTGNFEDVGHYTQMIWRGSTAFGCAIASNDRDDYLVCRYTPPGNVVGRVP
ncbi:MAG: serine protease [Sphingomonas sp. 28-63-12]|nr:MAG: serine protease [Sphingomonas sp. 28-63-12]